MSPATVIARMLAAGVLLLAAAPALAQQPYPNKPVRLIVPFPAGTSDSLARVVAASVAANLGQRVIVENRPGAGGNVGTEVVAKSAPDGYTLVLVAASFVTAPILEGDLPFDPVRDLAPVALVASSPNVLETIPDAPFKTVAQLVAYAKSRPGQLSYASAGNATLSHLLGEWFKAEAGIDMVHIPYKGGAPALVDAVAGHVPVYFSVFNTSLAQIKAGKLRPLATTGAERSTLMLEVPTVAESGYPGFEANNWYGMLTPAGVPREILVRLNAETRKTLQSPDVIERLTAQGYEIVPSTPEKLREHMVMETEKWAKVIKAANVRAE